MKPFRVPFLCCALAAFATAAEPAAAAWDNVFQVTCLFGRRQQTTVQYYTPASPVVVQSSPVVASAPVVASSAPCGDPCPQTQCHTSYVQRCYYQPVTTYQSQSYYQQVTTYRTSYYYEPVTSYTYSSYWDPCTCSCQQVAVPTTSYRLKSQCCPVTSWVQRCAQVPVTSYQKVSYWEPQTTCCSTTTGAAVGVAVTPVPAVTAAPQVAAPPVTTSPPPVATPAPSVTEGQVGVAPQVTEGQTGASVPQRYEQYYSAPPKVTIQNLSPSNGGTGYQPSLQIQNQSHAPANVTPPPPQVRLNRIVSERRTQGGTRWVQGQVVRNDSAPRGNAKLVFVNADRPVASEEQVTANDKGRFHVSLASGRWNVYLDGPDGRRVYHSRIDVEDGDSAPFITLVSR